MNRKTARATRLPAGRLIVTHPGDLDEFLCVSLLGDLHRGLLTESVDAAEEQEFKVDGARRRVVDLETLSISLRRCGEVNECGGLQAVDPAGQFGQDAESLGLAQLVALKRVSSWLRVSRRVFSHSSSS